MAISDNLGPALEQVVTDLVRTGRYGSKGEVLREGLRLVQAREVQLQKLQAELELGLADLREGRFYPAEEVFDEIEAKIAAKMQAAE